MTINESTIRSVAVRALCEFAAKRGDLDTRFTPSPNGREGIAAHQWVQRKRGKHYQAELPLQGQFAGLTLRGRADGYDPKKNCLEEIKTHLGDAGRIPEHHRDLHWAQAKVYAALLCAERGIESLDVNIVYLDYLSLKETIITQTCSAQELAQFATTLCEQYKQWYEAQERHRIERDAVLKDLAFPFPEFRVGQRDMARAVFAAATRSQNVKTDEPNTYPNQLIVQAPTGIGKTLASLYGLLRSMPSAPLDKGFYLTPKSSGKQLAWHALQNLGAGPKPILAEVQPGVKRIPIRVVELVAKDKACEYPENECHPLSCPLAAGFYDRLAVARTQAAEQAWLTPAAVRTVALANQVCPYYLTQEMVRWSDIVIGDYNYYCDASAMLYGLTMGLDWKVGLLFDEAHNLLERSRAMYSGQLEQKLLQLLRKQAPRSLRNSFVALDRLWTNTFVEHVKPYQVVAQLPRKFIEALNKLIRKVLDYFVQYPAEQQPLLKDFMFKAIQFVALADQLDQNSLLDLQVSENSIKPPGRSSTLAIRNIIPANLLVPRWAGAQLVVLFSATLMPMDALNAILGLRETAVTLDIAGPFKPEQLQVQIAQGLSTKYHDRQASMGRLTDIVAEQYRLAPGNYMAFFSSYSYMQAAHAQFIASNPDITAVIQQASMSEVAQLEYLGRFTDSSCQVGFAVLGGSFSEGVDLPGRRLIGAFIATLGMPQINEINEQFRIRMNELLGLGFERQYLYPGIQKVVQAAGRVIRTPEDRGFVWLLDNRFDQTAVRQLLPSWWSVKTQSTPQ